MPKLFLIGLLGPEILELRFLHLFQCRDGGYKCLKKQGENEFFAGFNDSRSWSFTNDTAIITGLELS